MAIQHFQKGTMTQLHIKPTCFGCGIISKIGCGINPFREGTDFNKCKGDSLVDFNEDHQFTISLPVVTKGKNFGKPQTKQVTFNSVRCANLTLLDMLGGKALDLGEYRASHGYMRCPMCRTINRGEQFCNSICKDKYEAEVGTILEVATQLAPSPTVTRFCRSGKKCLRFHRKPAVAKGKSPYCGSNCGASDRARAKRSVSGLAMSNNPLETRMSIGDFYPVSTKSQQGVEISML
jgi:hypothetical protein